MPRRTTRRSIWALMSVVALAGSMLYVVAAPASAAATTTLSLQSAGFKVVGSPYTWTFSASRGGTTGTWLFNVRAQRAGHHGKASQSHTWNFTLPATDVKISKDLATVRINTHADLASTIDYGVINLHTTQKTKLRTVNTKCAKTRKVLFRSSNRNGKLGGTFDFKPNAGVGMPADVIKAPIPFTVTRSINFNRGCGGGGGGGGGGGCTTSKSFNGTLFGPPELDVAGGPIGKSSFLTISQFASGPSIAPATSIFHSIFVSGPASALVIKANGNATISGSIATPFLSSTKLTYKGGAKHTFVFGKCKNIVYTDSYLRGSLNVNFDSGAVLLNGSSVLNPANTTRIVKA